MNVTTIPFPKELFFIAIWKDRIQNKRKFCNKIFPSLKNIV